MSLTLRRPALVALGAGIAVPFGLEVPGATETTLAVGVLIWPLLVVPLVLMGDREWEGLKRDRVARFLLGYLVASAVSLPIGLVAFHDKTGLWSYAFSVALVSNFAAGYLILRSREDVRLLVQAFVVSLGVIAIGLDVYVLQAGALLDPHAIHNSTSLPSVVYGWPNVFSVVVAVAAVMAVEFVTAAKRPIGRLVFGLLAAVLVACLFLTFSKTGWVAAGVAAWLLVLRHWHWRRQLVLLCALAAAAALFFLHANESQRSQLFTIETLGERLTIVADVFRYVNPLYVLVGSGSQNLETLLAAYGQVVIAPHVSLDTLSPHDQFLDVLVKGGVASLVCFVLALVLVMRRTRVLAERDDPFFRYWHAACWGVVASLFVGEELRYWPVAALFWLVAGGSAHLVAWRAQAAAGSNGRTAEEVDFKVASTPLG